MCLIEDEIHNYIDQANNTGISQVAYFLTSIHRPHGTDMITFSAHKGPVLRREISCYFVFMCINCQHKTRIIPPAYQRYSIHSWINIQTYSGLTTHTAGKYLLWKNINFYSWWIPIIRNIHSNYDHHAAFCWTQTWMVHWIKSPLDCYIYTTIIRYTIL